MAPWTRNMLGAPIFEPNVFRSKCTILKKVLVTLLGLFGDGSDAAPGTLCLPRPPGYDLQPSTLCLSDYATDRHRQAAATLKMQLIHNPGFDRLYATHFLTLLHPCLTFDPYFGNHWTRSTNRLLC